MRVGGGLVGCLCGAGVGREWVELQRLLSLSHDIVTQVEMDHAFLTASK